MYSLLIKREFPNSVQIKPKCAVCAAVGRILQRASMSLPRYNPRFLWVRADPVNVIRYHFHIYVTWQLGSSTGRASPNHMSPFKIEDFLCWSQKSKRRAPAGLNDSKHPCCELPIRATEQGTGGGSRRESSSQARERTARAWTRGNEFGQWPGISEEAFEPQMRTATSTISWISIQWEPSHVVSPTFWPTDLWANKWVLF